MGLTAVFAFFKSPLGKYALAALAMIGIFAGALLYIGHVRNEGEKAGAAEVTVKIQQRTIEVQRKITDAESRGPRNSSDVVKRLRDGSF